MAEITFVYPDFESLGVEYLMTFCLKEEHTLDFVYYDAEDIFISRRRKQIPYHKIAKKIVDAKPHIVAFSCVTGNYQIHNCNAPVLVRKIFGLI